MCIDTCVLFFRINHKKNFTLPNYGINENLLFRIAVLPSLLLFVNNLAEILFYVDKN